MDRDRPFQIFVSYRRGDSSGYAGRLYDILSSRFGDGNVFMDIDTIDPGADFAATITRAVTSCNIVLAVIGRDWLTAADADGRRRLDDPHDWVRLELETAFAHDVVVIPTCVEGAVISAAEELPPSLAALSRRQAAELRDVGWRDDTERLMRRLERLAGRGGERVAVTTAPARPAKPRWRSRRLLALLGAGAAVVAAGVVALLLVQGGSSRSSDQRRLIASIPAVTRPSCRPISWGPQSALASVECGGTQLTASYSRFPSDKVASGFYVQQRIGKASPNTGSCKPESMHGERPYSTRSTDGRYVCWIDKRDRTPHIMWTDRLHAVVAEAHLDEGTGPKAASSLLDQWRCCFQLEP